MADTRIGVVLVGHGESATALLAAARPIVGDTLDDVVCVDAGVGQTPQLSPTLCDAMDRVDQGRGVLVLVDLLGASPCNCVLREGSGRRFAMVSGMNLAMLLKLAASRNATLGLTQLAAACAESGQRSITTRHGETNDEQTSR